jgi:hypothetical protein
MRRNDHQPVPPAGVPHLSFNTAVSSGGPARLEPCAAGPAGADHGDEAGTNWENAWIDLGGEG